MFGIAFQLQNDSHIMLSPIVYTEFSKVLEALKDPSWSHRETWIVTFGGTVKYDANFKDG